MAIGPDLRDGLASDVRNPPDPIPPMAGQKRWKQGGS
jgi:hypothetical protein